jgi:hypothetical protein
MFPFCFFLRSKEEFLLTPLICPPLFNRSVCFKILHLPIYIPTSPLKNPILYIVWEFVAIVIFWSFNVTIIFCSSFIEACGNSYYNQTLIGTSLIYSYLFNHNHTHIYIYISIDYIRFSTHLLLFFFFL